MNWLEEQFAKLAAKRVRRKLEMTGWKSKVGGIGAICTGVGMIAAGLVGEKFNFDLIKEGLVIVSGGFAVLGVAHKIEKAGAVKIIALALLLASVGLPRHGVAQDTPSAISLEGGVASFDSPQAQFGLLLGEGATRSYSRFAYQSDGTARQVETGVERVILTHRRFSIVSRALAGIAQNESNTSGTVAGQFGFVVPIRWGFSVAALGQGSNSPISEGVWVGSPCFLSGGNRRFGNVLPHGSCNDSVDLALGNTECFNEVSRAFTGSFAAAYLDYVRICKFRFAVILAPCGLWKSPFPESIHGVIGNSSEE